MVLSMVIAALTFLSLVLLALVALRGVGRPMDERIRSLAAARQKGSGLESVPFQQRVIVPVLESIGTRLAPMLPAAFVGRTEHRLVLAGMPLRASVFHALVMALGTLFAGAYLFILFIVTDGAPHPAAVLMTALVAAIGAYLPMFWLSSQARGRQSAMIRVLPDSLDLITICVEAGLALDGAFQQVTEKQPGPFADEIRQMLREIGIGKTRRQALQDLAERTDIDDVRGFANAVIQAEQLGTSLAQVLRVQAQRLRMRRRQRAEQEARRAPVKMVFPLVFCLMPSLFVFILGPIYLNIREIF